MIHAVEKTEICRGLSLDEYSMYGVTRSLNSLFINTYNSRFPVKLISMILRETESVSQSLLHFA